MRSLLAALLIALHASVAWAQDPPPVNPPAQTPQRAGARGQRPGGPAGQGLPQQQSQLVQEMLDSWAVTTAERRLQLSREQNPVFYVAFRDLQALRRQHRLRRFRLIGELRQLTRPAATTDEATLTARTKAVDDLEVQWAQEEARAIAAVDRVLTAVQRARFRVFEEEMELKKLDLIAQVTAGGRRPAPAPGPGRR